MCERYLVYVGLFFRKVKFAEALVLDFLEKVVPEELADKGVFEGLARRVRAGQALDVVRVEEIGRETCDRVLVAGWLRGAGRRTGRRGGRLVPDFGSLQRSRLGPWGGRARVRLGHRRQTCKTGDSNKRREVVVRMHELHGGRWARPRPIFAPSGESDGLKPARSRLALKALITKDATPYIDTTGKKM